jgi:2-iminobutanoate/2-iminopropanoate deaminase
LRRFPRRSKSLVSSISASVKNRRRGALVTEGIAAETERVFRNLPAVSKAAGRSFDDVVRAGVHPANMNDFVAMNGIYATHFRQPFPARTTIAVAALRLGACVEIDLVAKA